AVVVVDVADRDARLGADVAQRDGVEAAPPEESERGVLDASLALREGGSGELRHAGVLGGAVRLAPKRTSVRFLYRERPAAARAHRRSKSGMARRSSGNLKRGDAERAEGFAEGFLPGFFGLGSARRLRSGSRSLRTLRALCASALKKWHALTRDSAGTRDD